MPITEALNEIKFSEVLTRISNPQNDEIKLLILFNLTYLWHFILEALTRKIIKLRNCIEYIIKQ